LGDYAIYSLTKIFPMTEGGIITGGDLDIPKLNDYNPKKMKHVEQEFTRYLSLLPEFSRKRKENFEYLLGKFNKISLEPFYTINNDVTPYFFPLKIQNNVSQISNEINKKGVECGIWHGEDAILLPIHPLLDKNDLDYIVKTVEESLLGGERI